MNLTFKQTAYLLSAYNKDMSNVTIFKEKLQFKYDDVDFKKFSKHYVSSGWLKRKLVALPKIFWSGVVKTIYDLAKAILIGSIKAFSDHGSYLKTQIFHAARDLQGSFGWLITLFHDKYGSYHVQESQFHKTCYDGSKKGPITPADKSDTLKSTITDKIKNLGKLDEIQLKELLNEESMPFTEKQLIFLENYIQNQPIPLVPLEDMDHKKLMDYLDQFQKKALSDEYAELLNCSLEDFFRYIDLNRYRNVGPTKCALIPIDSNILVNGEKHTYSNASRLPYSCVAFNGPFAKYFDDFIQLILTTDSNTVLSLGKSIEKGQIKYDKWFGQHRVEGNKYTLNLIPHNRKQVHYFSDDNQPIEDKDAFIFDRQGIPFEGSEKYSFGIRKFEIREKESDKLLNTILHIDQPSLTDHGTPTKESFYHVVKWIEGNLLAHCSAGIGRTGIYLTYIIMKNFLANKTSKECSIDIIGMTQEEIRDNPELATIKLICILRLRRPGFVQTDDQLKFLIERVKELVKTH